VRSIWPAWRALGAIANVDREEIDLVAVQHEIGSVRGMLEPF
jgi:hypothetical protein